MILLETLLFPYHSQQRWCNVLCSDFQENTYECISQVHPSFLQEVKYVKNHLSDQLAFDLLK